MRRKTVFVPMKIQSVNDALKIQEKFKLILRIYNRARRNNVRLRLGVISKDGCAKIPNPVKNYTLIDFSNPARFLFSIDQSDVIHIARQDGVFVAEFPVGRAELFLYGNEDSTKIYELDRPFYLRAVK